MGFGKKSFLKGFRLSYHFFWWFISMAVLLLIAIFLFQTRELIKRSKSWDLWVDKTNDFLKSLHEIETATYHIETANRGYLLTGRSAFLRDYYDGVKRAEAALSHLQTNAQSSERLRSPVAELSVLVQNKLIFSKRLVETEGMVSNQSGVLPEQLLKLNQQLRDYIQNLQRSEAGLLEKRRTQNRNHRRRMLEFSMVMSAGLVTLLLFSILKLKQNMKKRMEAEQKVLASEERYRLLIEDAGVATLVINDAHQIKFASSHIKDITGISSDEILNTSFWQYIPEEDLQSGWKLIEDVRSRPKENHNYEIRILNINDGPKWVSCKFFPLKTKEHSGPEWQIVLWDVDDEYRLRTEFEAMENARRRQATLVQNIIDSVPLVMFIKSTDGKYEIVNRQMEKVMGMSAQELIGKTDDDLNLDERRHQIFKESDLMVLHHKETVAGEDVIYFNGEKRYFSFTKLPLLDETKEVKYICGIAADITDFKEVESKLIVAREKAEEAKMAQEAFLAAVSHEIRTPMNGIIGMTGLLMDTPLEEDQKEFLESIQEAATGLLVLINDLLDISKIQSGKFQFENLDFNLRSVLNKLLYPLRFKAEEKNLELSLNLEDGAFENVQGDPTRLQQIVINLVSNAIKFTEKGSIKLDARTTKTDEDSVMLTVSVSDTGAGIPENKLGEIFDSYTQTSESIARLYGGTGLGLNIVKQLVNLQHGQVWVESQEGKGSVFTVQIPYKITKEPKKEVEESQQKNEQELLNKRILVAEDNLINQKVVLHVLEKKGAKVALASDGKEAIEKLKQEDFDLVLMDMQMPEMDGYEATQYIRKNMESKIPVIAMTAHALKGEAEKCYEAGADGYISKPFNPSSLCEQIIDMLKKDNEKPQEPLVDFSYVEELADGKQDYMLQVLSIFMEHTPPGMEELNRLVRNTHDWDEISKQAHFLKSSVGIIRIKGMHEGLQEIETLARNQENKERITALVNELTETFSKAKTIILQRMEAES